MDFSSKVRDSIEVLEEFRKAIIESDIVLDELISGTHKSKSGGYGTEFLDYRGYVFGDDLRFLDWKVFLRSNKYFIKRFEDNKKNSVYLFLDISESMFQKKRFIRALSILIAVANIFLKMKDDVFLLLKNENVRIGEYGSNQLIQIINEIYKTQRPSKEDFLRYYVQIQDFVPNNSIVCLFSDLFSDPDSVVDTINIISGTNIYQYVFHIVNDEELKPSQKGLRLFLDPDTDNTLLIQCDNIWDEYKKEIESYISNLNNSLDFNKKGKYILCSEDKSLRDILFSLFELG